MQKKILLLGGSHGQLPVIEEAKKRGLYTVLCDYLPDNPGRALVDRYYEVSTTDKNAVLKIANKHEIDAVLAYASDPAAVTQAYVSEMLGLPGNAESSIALLSNKNEFRSFQQENNFNVPAFKSYSADQIHKLVSVRFDYPVIVKPVDASDSKGVFKADSLKQLKEKAEIALSFSRSGKIIVEKFIDAEGGNLHGDAFFIDGEMVFCMLGDRIISSVSNPLKPTAELYPSRLPDSIISDVQNEVAAVTNRSGFKHGPVNIEARITTNGDIFVMEIGPRSGGLLTPQAINFCTEVNLMEATVNFILENSIKLTVKKTFPTICYAIHTNKSGIFEEFVLNKDLQAFKKKEQLYVNPGDTVKPFSEAGSTLGVLILTFPNFDVVDTYLDNIYQSLQESVKLVPYQS